MSMKNFNETIGNRTRDLPTCSAVPQPTALPRATPPLNYVASLNLTCTELAMDKEACRILPYCLVAFNWRFGGINCFHLRGKTERRAGNVRVRLKETERMAWLPERTKWIQCDSVRPEPGSIQLQKKVRMWKCLTVKVVKKFLHNVKRESWRGKNGRASVH